MINARIRNRSRFLRAGCGDTRQKVGEHRNPGSIGQQKDGQVITYLFIA